MKKVGILALQGSFAEHGKVLERLGEDFVWVRCLDDLKDLTHLIVPGGESTTLTILLQEYGMWEEIQKKLENSKTGKEEKLFKIFGTCAGAILCSKWGMDIEVERNAYGAQQESAVTILDSEKFSELEGVFIRAPRFKVESARCKEQNSVRVLASWNEEPVFVEQGNFLAASFHPELTEDVRVHEYFLES